jgi:hypothetical protein
MKPIIAMFTLMTALAAYSAPKAEVIEHCSHDIMKLTKSGAIPADAANKLHMIRVKEVDGGYQVVAVLDHNEDHSQPVAHLRLQYGTDAKMKSYEYKEGYVNPANSPFNRKSAAKLFDIAAEILLEASGTELAQYAEKVEIMELHYDAAKDAALFEMFDGKRGLKLWLDLDGKYLDSQFE